MTEAMPVDLDALTPEQRTALIARLQREAVRITSSRTYRNGHRLSLALESDLRPTPMLDMIADGMQQAIDQPRGRLLVSSPPQIGKSMTVAIWGAVRALVGDPSLRIVVASYSESLARRHVRTARDLVARYGSDARDSLTGVQLPDQLGIGLRGGKATETEWQVAGSQGGMYAVGVGGSLSGKPADVLIVDDPLKGMTEADSELVKRRLLEWWQSVALARLSPTASVILVQTRWTEDDLAGHALEQGGWEYLNFPAVAERGVADALDRKPGTPLETSRGHTMETWRETKAAVGPRVWTALYQGNPTPTGGGLFLSEWFERHRLAVEPKLQQRLVSVDPAETGHRDEAGIVGLGCTPDGRVAVTHDWSGRMTSDQWARKAVLLALTTKAHELMFEAYTTEETYRRVILQAWQQVEAELRLLRRHGQDVRAAALQLSQQASPPTDPLQQLSQLVGLQPSGASTPPFRIQGHRGKGDKVARAVGARQSASTGRLVIVGALPLLEKQATEWQVGQSSPDRIDALTNGYNRIMELRGEPSMVVAPARAQRGRNPGLAARMGRKIDFK